MKKLIIYMVLLAIFLSGCGKNETQHSTISEKKYATENLESTEEDNAAEGEKRETDNVLSTEADNQTSESRSDDESTTKATVYDENSQTMDVACETPLSEKDESKTDICILSVSCESILNNMDKLDKNKVELVPSDGIILPKQTVEICSGESAFDITLKVMKEKKIHFEFVKTIAFNSAYIKGIGNIYEFDCGELSGWRYRVNGEYKGCGCSQYYPENGDRIEWIYTCE